MNVCIYIYVCKLSSLSPKICDKILVSLAAEVKLLANTLFGPSCSSSISLINSLNGSSSSVKATCWLESLVPAFGKQLTMTSTAFKYDTKVVMAWRIGILEIGWFLSNALIHIRTTCREEIQDSLWLDLKHQDGQGSYLLAVQCFWIYQGTYD